MTEPRARVVVVGAGFGGLNAAKALARLPVRTTVIDRSNHHLFTPLLYQVATALLEPGDIAQPVRSILRVLGNAEFRLATVTGMDLKRRVVRTSEGDLAYDHLIIAAGSTTEFFGNDELRSTCFQLKDLPGALRLRNRVLTQFETARWEPDAERRRTLLSFVVVGGGPTGVEFCGALAELIAGPLRRDLGAELCTEASVRLVEAGDSVLAAFAPSLRRAARAALTAKGVTVQLHSAIASVEGQSLRLRGGAQIEAGMVIWAAGVRAGDLAGRLPDVAHATRGTLRVQRTLQLEGHPEVFVVGDMADVEGHETPLPMLASVAIQEGRHAAASIGAILAGRSPAPFHYRDKGIMATVGRNAGVMQSGPIRLSGFAGWIAWLLVHLVLILGFRRKLLVLFGWFWNYVFSDRPIRLIVGDAAAGEPRSAQPDR
ncbi:MAG: NAD(P)/FAD-dependent oxidoreductase [Candidatus Dormibacteria bacterium]